MTYHLTIFFCIDEAFPVLGARQNRRLKEEVNADLRSAS